jgi:hypothetical protein
MAWGRCWGWPASRGWSCKGSVTTGRQLGAAGRCPGLHSGTPRPPAHTRRRRSAAAPLVHARTRASFRARRRRIRGWRRRRRKRRRRRRRGRRGRGRRIPGSRRGAPPPAPPQPLLLVVAVLFVLLPLVLLLLVRLGRLRDGGASPGHSPVFPAAAAGAEWVQRRCVPAAAPLCVQPVRPGPAGPPGQQKQSRGPLRHGAPDHSRVTRPQLHGR